MGQPTRTPAWATTEPGSIVFLDEPETGYTLDEVYELFSPGPLVDDEGEYVDTDEAITAAAEIHTGAMIALVPSVEDAQRLYLADGEELDQLHLTLTYLGDAEDIDDEARISVLDAIAQWASVTVTPEATAFSVNVFNPLGEEPCVVVGVGGSDLVMFHETAMAVAHDAGIDTSEMKLPWVPHITLIYVGGDDVPEKLSMLNAYGLAEQRLGDITFDRVRVALGDEVHDFPLAERA